MSTEKYHKQVLYEVDWQKRRLQCLGLWGTREGVEENLAILDTYVQGQTDTEEFRRRVWRVLNLLNAVLLGTHVGYRAPIVIHRDKLTGAHITWPLIEQPWDWSIVAEDLKKEQNRVLLDLKVNLRKRVYTANRRGLDYKHTRPELARFLSLLDREIEQRKTPAT